MRAALSSGRLSHGVLIHEDPGMVIELGAYLQPDQAAPVEAALFDEVEKLGAKGPTADELRKAKNQVQSGFVFSLEHAQGLAEAIGRSWINTGDPSSFLHDVDNIEKVSAADVQRVVKQYMPQDHATVVVIPPPNAPAPPAPAPTCASGDSRRRSTARGSTRRRRWSCSRRRASR